MYIDGKLRQLADTPSIIEWHLHNGFPVKLLFHLKLPIIIPEKFNGVSLKSKHFPFFEKSLQPHMETDGTSH